jgi:hypothetical protein
MKFTFGVSLLALAAGVFAQNAQDFNPTDFVAVQTIVRASTTFGENIFLTGSLPQLTGWSTGGVSKSPFSSRPR